jgi:hypothetical protein
MREAASLLTHADPTGLPRYDLLERGRAAIGLLQRERGTRALTDDEFDIADPHGRRPAAYRKMFEDVQAVVDTLAFVLAPATVRTPQQHPL